MVLWRAYIDESYNSRAFCVGCVLAPEFVWRRFTKAWVERISSSPKVVIHGKKRGFPPISRYHASGLPLTLKREFREKNGWDIPRQVRLTKRLCAIFAEHHPQAIVIGGAPEDIRSISKDDVKEFMYSACIKMCLLEIAGVMHRHPPGQVEIVFDRGNFTHIATEAFTAMQKEKSNTREYDCLQSMEAKAWDECAELQAADFIAYQGMQRVDGSLRGKREIKKSLQALIGKRLPIHIGYYTRQNFLDIRQMKRNEDAGRPIGEGVNSGLESCIGGVSSDSGFLALNRQPRLFIFSRPPPPNSLSTSPDIYRSLI